MQVYVANKRITIDPSDSIGKGGEADVYNVRGVAFKIFKNSRHPDFLTPEQRHAASDKLKEHQTKLKNFPKGLPNNVIVPNELVTDQQGKVIGYTMFLAQNVESLMRYGEKPFRQQARSVNNNVVKEFLIKILRTIDELHKKNIVIGDLNDLNILIQNNKDPFIIDADSFQFGRYMSRVYTEKFVDPILCDPNKKRPMLIQPHNVNSDWYAFAVMVMQSFLFVEPYGGVYKPQDRSKKVPHPQRSLKRITVFDPEVKYPKPARPYETLSDDLLQHLMNIFQKDKREPFPVSLLETTWNLCPECGMEHARRSCPDCRRAVPVVKEVVEGNVTYTRIFSITDGTILFADYQGHMRWLYWKDDGFYREGDTRISKGGLHHQMRFRINGDETIIGVPSKPAIVIDKKGDLNPMIVDFFGNLPIFDANGNQKFWLQDGVLYRDDALGEKRVGEVLKNQTLFWVGPKFGFGFYRAGQMSIAFVFGVNGKLNDSVELRITGKLIDSTCFFSKKHCWFFVSTLQNGKEVNQCYLIDINGKVVASEESDEADHPWLSNIRGKCAVGEMMFSASDEGLIRIQPSGNRIEVIKEFPDTEPFLDSGSHLFVGKEGIFVVGHHEIGVLEMK